MRKIVLTIDPRPRKRFTESNTFPILLALHDMASDELPSLLIGFNTAFVGGYNEWIQTPAR